MGSLGRESLTAGMLGEPCPSGGHELHSINHEGRNVIFAKPRTDGIVAHLALAECSDQYVGWNRELARSD